ncbi:MAG: 50S ribosomal protein L10 [Saccharofermentanales bacterium]|nr:50S ribosomal protein L10 [Clostridiaceae bacterium]
MPSQAKLKAKKQQVQALVDELKDAKSIVLVNYQGIAVHQDNAMRSVLRENGLQYRVVKNTITERAFQALGYEGLEDAMVGPTALAFSTEDALLAPRLMRQSTEKYRKLAIKGGIVDGQVESLDYLIKLSYIESRETLYGQLLFMMMYPLTAFAQVAGQIAEKGEEVGVEKVKDVPVSVASAPEAADEATTETA